MRNPSTQPKAAPLRSEFAKSTLSVSGWNLARWNERYNSDSTRNPFSLDCSPRLGSMVPILMSLCRSPTNGVDASRDPSPLTDIILILNVCVGTLGIGAQSVTLALKLAV
jgi:hypothetical protein